MHVYQVFTAMSLHTYDMSRNQYDFKIENMSHRAIMLSEL